MMDSISLLLVKWVFAMKAASRRVRITNEFNLREDIIFTSEIFVRLLLLWYVPLFLLTLAFYNYMIL